jgi:two-component system NarL family response regulator
VSEFLVRVAVVDHVPLFRLGVKQVLSGASDVDLVSVVGSVSELVPLLSDEQLDVLLIDSAHPAGCSTLCAQIRRLNSALNIIVMVSDENDIELVGAVRAGARGYVRRDVLPDELIDAITTVATGGSLISSSVAARLLDEFASVTRRSDGIVEGTSALSRRELDVLRLIAQGLNNKSIAASLYISENTVKNHVRSIHEKLQVHSRMEAVVRAVRDGLLEVG